ncbi:hypothetical protein BU15DRAFT_63767 [Melanogaster broomeanus]|nr:hypothetical protein BU15DRAFT_63767 [Melanogaster broomeanus]
MPKSRPALRGYHTPAVRTTLAVALNESKLRMFELRRGRASAGDNECDFKPAEPPKKKRSPRFLYQFRSFKPEDTSDWWRESQKRKFPELYQKRKAATRTGSGAHYELAAVASAQHTFVARDTGTGLTSLKLNGPASIPAEWTTSPLNPALASFSIETAGFEDYLGNATYPNTLSINLFNNLKKRALVAPEIRIGGNTADSTFWNSNQDVAFNLESLNYTGALSLAEAAWAGLGSRVVSRFEIGNEPDQYSLDFDARITRLFGRYLLPQSFQVGATAIDPLWPYNTSQADAQFDCVSALAAGANDGHTVTTCSEHTYQYSVCDPTRAAVATLTNLVNHTRLAEYLDLWQPRIHAVRSQLGPMDLLLASSTRSRAQVRTTSATPLDRRYGWVYVHQGGPFALQSSTQLNHGGPFYNLWYPVDNQNGPIQVFPSYSAYLFVSELIGGSKSLRTANIFPGRQAKGSSITTADGDPSAGQVSVYGYWEESSSDYPAKLAILNLEIYNSTATYRRPNVTVDFSAFLSTPGGMVTVKGLTAPGADIKYGNLTTWAGQNFASGVAEGGVEEEIITTGEVDVAASSAVLATLQFESCNAVVRDYDREEMMCDFSTPQDPVVIP